MASGSQQPLKRVRQMLVREREPGEELAKRVEELNKSIMALKK
jgi:hypothetical protein